MISILKHEVRKLISFPLWFLIAIDILFLIAERQNTSDHFEIFTLRMLTEHYLLIFCMTPIFLLSIYRSLEPVSPFILIRSRQFTNYFYTKWLSILFYTLLFVLLQVLIVVITGIGLPHGNFYPTSSAFENELFYYFEATISNPLVAILLAVLYMFIGLSFVGISILTIFHFFSRKMVIFVILLAYIMMILSIKMPTFSHLSFLSMNRFIILHHNFLVDHGVLWSIIQIIGLFIVQVILIRFAWYRKFSISWRPKGMFYYYALSLWTPQNWFILCGILGILTLWKSQVGMEESVQDYFLRFFYGFEIGDFHILTFLEQLVYYGTPLYLFAIFIQSMCSEKHFHVFIRIKKKRNWVLAVVSNGILWSILYTCLTFGFLILLSVLTNKSWTSHTIQTIESLQLFDWLMFFFLKILEFSLLFLLFFLLFICLKNVTVSYLIVMAMHAMNLLSFQIFRYNPAGIGTIARLKILEASNGIPLNHALLLLSIGVILLLSLIRGSYKRYFY